MLYVADLEEARSVASGIPGAVLCAEVDGLPVPGVAISNSPTMVAAADLAGRTLVQRSSAGVQALTAAAGSADYLFAACLVVAGATAQAIGDRDPMLVTLVVSLSVSQVRAEAEAVGLTLTEGFFQRLERFLALMIGLMVPHTMFTVLVVLAALGLLTLLQRSFLALRGTRL